MHIIKVLRAAIARIKFGMRSEMFKGHRLKVLPFIFSEYHDWDKDKWKKKN